MVWLRHYGTQQALGSLFGVSDSTALRAIRRCLPILQAQGKDAMRTSDPGRRQRRGMPALLDTVPGLADVLGTPDQATQQPEPRPAEQSAHDREGPASRRDVNGATDDFGRAPESTPGSWTDLKLVRHEDSGGASGSELDEVSSGERKVQPALIVEQL
jgi:hypothetical protein